jgi:hypothetical protein
MPGMSWSRLENWGDKHHHTRHTFPLAIKKKGKIYLTPGLIYPLNFAKPVKSSPRAVLSGGFATVTAVLLQ